MKKQILILVLGIFLLGNVLAIDSSYCCEKTTTGAWCQNAPEQDCATGFKKAPTSCDATAYCKLGTCYDSQEGTCMENTPQQVCQDSGGVWAETTPEETPQCQLGCCLIGDQAAFVTQVRCKRLASLYGLEINFQANIQSELQCIASATSDVKGACVFEEDFERTCRFTTKRECQSMGATGNSSEFHEDYLCSAESLNADCGPSDKTTCVESRDEVYFLDSCGNLANIYDASKYKDKEYWSKIYRKDESCNPSDNNANSKDCGNCDYFLGSTCKIYERGQDKSKPKYGDNICRDLSCEHDGKKYEHGETWCASSLGTGKISPDSTDSDLEKENLPGSRYFRMVCYNNEVSVEPCADFRQEVCIQDSLNGFSTAACRVNQWQDCYSQTKKKDCENFDRRDCQWIPGIELANVETDEKGACVPLFSPGFNFWETTSESESTCDLATKECLVVYEKSLTGKEKCVDGCECLEPDWEEKMNRACVSLGDCGSKKNFIGVQGWHNESAISSKDKDDD
jgi:hypothetical protein